MGDRIPSKVDELSKNVKESSQGWGAGGGVAGEKVKV